MKQKDELKRAFDLLDEKGVGTIDCQDIVIAIRALGLHAKSSEVLKLIRRYDPQKTETLDFRAFLCIIERLAFKEYSDVEIIKSFQIYCQGDSDFIRFKDLQKVASQLNEEMCEEDLQALFKEADLNNDGVIDFKEFSSILKRSPFSQNSILE
ncbi:hypothetical protein Aperf_G00000034811 [Anoplocephala perfoliata]